MSRLRHPKSHDDLLNFQLKRLFTLGGAPAVRLCEGVYGIPRSEWRIIAALVEGGPICPSALHARVGGDAGRASRLVASLIEKGLAVRRADRADKRRATICATPAAEAIYCKLFPQLCRINERLMSVLDEREADLLEQFLQRLTQHARNIQLEGDGVEARADRRRGGSRRIWSQRSSPTSVRSSQSRTRSVTGSNR